MTMRIARDKRQLLKIKLKSLGAESRFIRKEERKTAGDLREEMYLHRMMLRREARATHLAYGFIRGKSRACIEDRAAALSAIDQAKLLDRITAMASKYGSRPVTDVKDWMKV